MTDTTTDGTTSGAHERPRVPPAPVALAAVVAACWAALLGMLTAATVALVVWMADGGRASAGAAFRIAGLAWVLAHFGTVELADGRFAMAPLGFTLLIGYLLVRGGAVAARSHQVRTLRPVPALVAGIAVAYGLAVAGMAAFARVGAAHAGTARSFAGGALLAACCGGYGVLREAGLVGAAWRRLPEPLRLAVRGGALAAALLCMAGALAAGTMMALSGDQATRFARSLGVGTVGWLALLLLSLAFVPNAVGWAVAYLAGPGFAVGAGTSVSAFGVTLGPVPAFPLLAAVPDTPPGRWAWPLLAVPVLAGALAGHRVGRAAVGAGCRGRRALLTALATGPVAGLLVGGVALASGGPIGPGRMATLGPSAWQVGVAVAAQVTVAAGAVTGAVVLLERWRSRPASGARQEQARVVEETVDVDHQHDHDQHRRVDRQRGGLAVLDRLAARRSHQEDGDEDPADAEDHGEDGGEHAEDERDA
ncbi:MAG: DUF6350 family protein [Mycobacteriales bacterium]